jgi:2-methylisocitrate lyase-like PEP mutase family enzyme
MDRVAQTQKAEAFRRMHAGQPIVVLPNAWDAASARIFEAAGFKAVATTSAGVSYTAGYPDGELIPRDDMVTIVRWIASCVQVPVTADIESGFARDANDVAETISAVIEAGAVGVNLEDSNHAAARELYSLPVAVERIRAALEAAIRAGVPIVINARTDVFLLGIGEKATRFDQAVERLNAYREAGGGLPLSHRLLRFRNYCAAGESDRWCDQRDGRRRRPVSRGARSARSGAGQHRVGAIARGDDGDDDPR